MSFISAERARAIVDEFNKKNEPVNKFLNIINNEIEERAMRGYTTMRYAFDVRKVDKDVIEKVKASLREYGYTIHVGCAYTDDTILWLISW